MSNIFIRFGAEPSASQEVSEELKSRGINLLRREPRAVQVQGGATTIQPNFAFYKSHLPAFMKAAVTGNPIKKGSSVFVGLTPVPGKRIPLIFPDLLVSWNIPIAEEVRDEMRGKGWIDTMSKGKSAMLKSNPTIEDAVYARSKGVLITTPSGENSMNIASFRQALVIQEILETFLLTHQYPAFVDEDHESEFNKSMQEKDEDEADAQAGDDDDDSKSPIWQVAPGYNSYVHLVGSEWESAPTRSYRVNLPEKPTERMIVRDEHQMPSGSGLLFQFVDELCKFDRQTVPETISRYFIGCLDDEEEGALEAFEDISRAWGNLFNSDWANRMSHLFKILDITLRCQAEMIVMFTAGRYDGCFMRGAGYRVTIGGLTYVAKPATEIAAALPNMDYHGNALWRILQKISFISEEVRVDAFRTTRSMKKLKEYLDAMQLVGGNTTREAVMKDAKFLAFPEDSPLDPNATNIALVLSTIADPTKDLNTLPYLHHTQLFETKRSHIAWSVFGEEAPSFRVPGGKTMFLKDRFTVTSAKLRQEKGPTAHRDVSKIGVQIVPLKLALEHLDATIEHKNVMNPFGNVIVNAAASHMNKVFEGDSCTKIVEGLRKVCRVTVADAGSGGTKRRGDEIEGGSVPKKGRRDFGF